MTIAFMKRKPNWKNPPAQPIGHMSLITTEMYQEVSAARRREATRERARTAALYSRPPPAPTFAPLATSVELITLNSKTLKDVLGPMEVTTLLSALSLARQTLRTGASACG